MRLSGILTALLLLLCANTLWALQQETFTEERFRQLQNDNARILVDIHADWCPTCSRQQAVLTLYEERFPESDVVVLKIDFDKQKKWVKHFKAPRQSTFILYQGKEREWFSVAETRPEVIFARLNGEGND